MKKLKLLGIKKGLFGREVRKVVADIYVKDGKIVVESKDKKAGDKLQKELNRRLSWKGGFYLGKSREKRDKNGELLEHVIYGVFTKPDEPKFLNTLRSRGFSGFWSTENFGDYEIHIGLSKIVDE